MISIHLMYLYSDYFPAMKTLHFIVLCLAIMIGTSVDAQPGGYFPPPYAVDFHDDTLTIFPPDSLPGDPVVLIGYNVFVDSNFYDNLEPDDPLEPVDFPITTNTILPGTHSFCANAVYNTWISDNTCDTATLTYGFELPFLEDWSTGIFETQQWTTSGGNWIIDGGEGNPSPGAVFLGEPALINYEVSLESYPLDVLNIYNGSISMEFDIKLVNNQPTGNEKLWLQSWNWTTQNWSTVKQFNNEGGSFTWLHCMAYNMMAKNSICKIRFLAFGVNSSDIQSWSIDNITINRECGGIYYLYLDEYMDHNKLTWDGLGGGCGDWWLHWDDGVFSGNSIGTGEAAEFDVAARWTPYQLIDYTPSAISQISFFPAEPSANYSARIWEGEGAGELVYDSVLTNLVIGQWNTISLENPVPIDGTRELWVGYHINTPTGYPAGVDDGPAINGNGNMIYFDGAWQTLLEINPDLDFNWNISFHIQDTPDPYWFYKIYRQTNSGDFQYYASTPVANSYTDWTYLDTNITLSDYYCYAVSAVWIQYGDTCESTENAEICETDLLGIDPTEPSKSMRIYPNPATYWLNIESEEPITRVRIYNLLGNLLMDNLTCAETLHLDVSSLREGMYYIRAAAGRQEIGKKILIK
jgi:hypothetical protein